MHLSIDKSVFKEIASFSGWSMFANASIALNSQGILLLLNMFFAPAVVAARSISLQVSGMANLFVNNFQIAANPQIVKLYAAGDHEGSKQLLLQTTKVSYYLSFVLALPICLTTDSLLHLWLGIVPEYAVIFLQLVVIQSLFQVFDTSFYRALYAKGRIKENALISPTLGLILFPVIYILFKLGFSPVALSWVSLIKYAIAGLIIKPIMIVKIVGYKWNDVFVVFKPCLLVTIASVPFPLMTAYMINTYYQNEIISFLVIVSVSVISVGITTWFLGLTDSMRKMAMDFVFNKIRRTKQ